MTVSVPRKIKALRANSETSNSTISSIVVDTTDLAALAIATWSKPLPPSDHDQTNLIKQVDGRRTRSTLTRS